MNSYRLFQLGLYPVLPILIWQARAVKNQFPIPIAQSEKIVLGTGSRRYLILGESTAAGVGASSIDQTIAGHFFTAKGESTQVINFGKNGIRVAECLDHFQSDLIELSPEIVGVLLFFGANDTFKLTHPHKYRKDFQQLIVDLQSRFNPKWIYLADIPPVHLFPAFPPFLKKKLRIQREFLTHEMEQLANQNPILIFQKLQLHLSPSFFCEDQIHPSDQGYKAIVDFVLQSIRE
ncbi:SGNH/GDSL hydrolase family protein [Algoriphagus hitonicola]|uniref:Lysophospholipase L1 n=1 Tax=Algoriphagus hitonicola TaxID=435880 RepID=A0A1I2WKV6_9BACT|nr:SGNH/GDSL hydrolase family protein [Algoriphagus hitonicola]SFH01935.1 Lysophospholipase L1 [Algoriphagus hitonicola]